MQLNKPGFSETLTDDMNQRKLTQEKVETLG